MSSSQQILLSVISAIFSRSFFAIHSLATALKMSFSSTQALARDLLPIGWIQARCDHAAGFFPPAARIGKADVRPDAKSQGAVFSR